MELQNYTWCVGESSLNIVGIMSAFSSFESGTELQMPENDLHNEIILVPNERSSTAHITSRSSIISADFYNNFMLDTDVNSSERS